MPREIEEAAVIDGAGYWRIYWSVILPLSKPILSALAILFLSGELERVPVAADGGFRPEPLGRAGRLVNFKSEYSAAWDGETEPSIEAPIGRLFRHGARAY